MPGVSLVILRQVRAVTLIVVGILRVTRGGRSRTQGLHHSVDVLIQYGVHPYQLTEWIHLPPETVAVKIVIGFEGAINLLFQQNRGLYIAIQAACFSFQVPLAIAGGI